MLYLFSLSTIKCIIIKIQQKQDLGVSVLNQGYVYILINESYINLIKIGSTSFKSEDRAKRLSATTGVPTPFKVAFEMFVDNCKEFEKETFSDPRVQKNFGDMLLLQVDMTKNSEENRALMTKYKDRASPVICYFPPVLVAIQLHFSLV